jgi:translocator protein
MHWALFFTFLAACGAAATTGALFKPGDWYDTLKKPDWFPPRWVFPVAWTTLYLVMSIAATRVAVAPDNAQAMAFWALQIAVNTLWTPIFFGLHRIRFAMGVIVVLWLSVAATTWSFFGVDIIAGLLFLPYLAWVTAASALNLSAVQLNPQVQG